MEEKIVIQIPIEEIVPNPYQPRRVFSEKSLEELKNSIESYGVLQPITVSLNWLQEREDLELQSWLT